MDASFCGIGSSLILPHGFGSRQFSGFFNPEICRGTESHRVHSFVWPVATKSAEKFRGILLTTKKTGGSPRNFVSRLKNVKNGGLILAMVFRISVG